MSDQSIDPEDPSDLMSKATESLVDQLRSVFSQVFSDSSLEYQFKIKQSEESNQEVGGPWTFCVGMPSPSEDPDGGYKFHFSPKSSSGDSDPTSVRMKIEGATEEGKVNLKIGSGQGRSKTFNLLKIIHVDGEGWKRSPDYDYTSLQYSQRRFSPNVLEVWFPQSGREENSVLQIPVRLETELGVESSDVLPRHWARFADEGVEVALPEVKEVEEGEFSFELGDEKVWKHISLSFLMYWIVCNVYAEKGILRKNGSIPAGFPAPEKYRAVRPVNLEPTEVIEDLEADENDDKLYLPWHVIESACSALNAGKNVIFTGPPGCGKSKLASFLAEKATGQDPLMTTASPAWSTGDLIGRYMPDPEGNGLVFQEGVFLRAIGEADKRSEWLVIDEFNRADIDSCFGELFSVLAGDAVKLPFEKQQETGVDTEEDETDEDHLVRIAPEGDETETKADYLLPDTFRLIGTMNDADQSGLNDLSFALKRRFAIIPVEAPSSDRVKEIIEDHIDETNNDLDLEDKAWDASERGTRLCKLGSVGSSNGNGIGNQLESLFASPKRRSNDDFQDLVAESVVGVSVVKDVIRFVGEGIRGGRGESLMKGSLDVSVPNKAKWAQKTLSLSYLALATVLQIFPQLEALGMAGGQQKDTLDQAVKHIFDTFDSDIDYDSHELLMLRIKKGGDGENKYRLDSEETIAEFLFRNLENRFPQHARQWRKEENLGKYLPKNGDG